MTPRVSRAFFSHFDSWSLPGEQIPYHTVEDIIATGPVQGEDADPARTNCTSRISGPSRKCIQKQRVLRGGMIQQSTRKQSPPFRNTSRRARFHQRNEASWCTSHSNSAPAGL